MSYIQTVAECTPYDFFYFNDTATTEIYTLSLHDALPISQGHGVRSGAIETVAVDLADGRGHRAQTGLDAGGQVRRSEEHTSELQSHLNLVCRLLLEKKNYRQAYTR